MDYKKEVVQGNLFQHDAEVVLQRKVFERYQKIAGISILDSALYGDFAKMVYETFTHLLPYINYEIRPEVRQSDWMVHDENGKLIR